MDKLSSRLRGWSPVAPRRCPDEGVESVHWAPIAELRGCPDIAEKSKKLSDNVKAMAS